MNEAQTKIYRLMENYFEYCTVNGYTEFRMWCLDNIDTIAEAHIVIEICRSVNHIASELFEYR